MDKLREKISVTIFNAIASRKYDAPSMHREEFEIIVDAILNLPEMKEMIECQKTLALIAECMKAGDFSKIVEWKEKAEKWNSRERITLPIKGTILYDEIVKKGCGGYSYETQEGIEHDCHYYSWMCDECPVWKR